MSDKTGAPAAPPTNDNADLLAQIAAFKAREADNVAALAAAENARAESDKARVRDAFDRAVEQRRVTPAQFAAFDVLREARSADFAIEQIKACQVNAAYSAQPIGHNASETPAPTPAPSHGVAEVNEWAAVDLVLNTNRSLAKYKKQLQDTNSLIREA